METIIFLLVVIFISSLINSIFGFGFALVCMTILSLHFEMNLLGPMIPLLFLASSIVIVYRGWKDVKLAGVKTLLFTATLFVPIGVYLSKYGNPMYIKTSLGLFIISVSVYHLSGLRLPHLKNNRWAPLFGALSGFFGGAYNISGPPVVIYGTLRRWSPQSFRVTLQAYFLFVTILVIISHLYLDSYKNPEIPFYFLTALPVMLLAVPIGKVINKRITNIQTFNRYVYILMLIMGIVTIIRALG